uniref:Slc8a-4 n=1 Tax=Schmidtea mediterranea TaxID=79327 RepID=A0A0H3YK36_SCHMD|nr:slc8a-4 [Schmidtea mediterranea]
MLSVIEVCGKNFQSGALGPGTIVGSAAFNLFIIIGVCIAVVPDGEIRRIQQLNVFFVTATFSVIAYVWMYMILGVISVGIIEVWEAVLTFLLFPLTVVLAYLTDKRILSKLCSGGCRRRYGPNRILMEKDDEILEFEQLRASYMVTLQEMRKKYPNARLQSLEKMTLTEIFEKAKKSRAFYKMQATRMFTGGGNLVHHGISKLKTVSIEECLSGSIADERLQRIFFEPCHYTIMENVGIVKIFVKRAGGYLGSSILIDYETEEGTALPDSDYIHAAGTLIFKPYEIEKIIEIKVVDDEIFEEEEHFTVRLFNLRVKNGKENFSYIYEISKMNRATVLILDDDHCGTFGFEADIMHIEESCNILTLNVYRNTGARGIIKIPYTIMDGTAKADVDYVTLGRKVVFKNEEIFKTISIKIIDGAQYSKDNFFFVELGQPKVIEKSTNPERKDKRRFVRSRADIATKGLPTLGSISIVQIHIHESSSFKSVVDKLIKQNNLSKSISSTSWKEQFTDALTVYGGDSEDGSESEPQLISFILHYITVFWKVLFAFIPPTDYLGGWLCFIVSIFCIGVLTAMFGDLASSFGCTLGLLDEVVAITFVAVGTSLPDTFASKYAAINDETADNSIGNVTGSNAVNVYLGLGLAWSMASIVNSVRGEVFYVTQGALGFSVTLFCILALFALMLIFARRHPALGGGELGGPLMVKYISSAILISLYFIYVIISSLQAYCHIKF